MMKKILGSMAMVVLSLSLVACGNAGSELVGQWKSKVSMMGVSMPGHTLTITQDAITSGGSASKVAKWEKSGDHITAYDQQGHGLVFTMIDHDHATVNMGAGVLELTRIH